MYDYTEEPTENIENVDHEIHIMGIKLGYFPYLMWGFLIGLFTGGPLVGFLLIGVAVVICRALYKAEERGEPITFDPRFEMIISRLPKRLGAGLLAGATNIERARSRYRD